MAYSVVIHIANEEPIVAEMEKLPSGGDTVFMANNPRQRDGKDLRYLAANTVMAALLLAITPSTLWWTGHDHGNWAKVPAAVKNMANIQCEECHGPAADHVKSGAPMASSMDEGVCNVCHNGSSRHDKGEQLKNAGADAVLSESPEAFVAFTRAERVKWGAVVKASGVKIEPLSVPGRALFHAQASVTTPD